MRIRHHSKSTRKLLSLFPFLLACLVIMAAAPLGAQSSTAAEKQITGKVVDNQGNPLAGVTITVKGYQTKGAITNSEGDFLITGVPGDIFAFSFIGFITKEMAINDVSVTRIIVMEPDIQSLEDIVVVGYGVQKKVSVVGAISTVNTKEIQSFAAPSISQALVGKVPGLISQQASGEPGQDQAQLYIRGLSTWADTKPIVIVDGIERELNTLNTTEIDTISFLKDATATAVYGIRGANGVIIITTKKGTVGAPVVTLRSEFAQLHGLRFPKLINSGEYAELWNEARVNDGLSPTYTPEQVMRYYDGSDPYNYPNINWMNEIFKKNTFQTINNVSIRGGTEKVRYFVNLGYTMQDGLFRRDPQFEYNTNVRMHRYNLRTNVDIQLAPSLIAEVGLGIISKEQKHPAYYTYELMRAAMEYAPNKVPMYNPDGTFSAVIFNNWTNPYMQATHGGYSSELTNNVQGTFSLKWDLSSLITKGLTWTNTFSFDQYQWGLNRRYKGITSKQYLGVTNYGEENYRVWYEKSPETYLRYSGSNRNIRLYSQLSYSRSFGKHNVSGMALFNIGEGVDLLADLSVNALPSRQIGFSGRAVYDYDTRYIVEFSFGYNGSENFAPGRRLGFFPGVAVGWNVAQENFWNLAVVSTLKIRGGAGQVGNDRTGVTRFAYTSTTESAAGFLQGDFNSVSGFTEGRIGAKNAITWETATKYNVGIELGMFNERLSFTVDAFQEYRGGLLVQRIESTPKVSGFRTSQLPYANIGKSRNRGIEAMLEAKNTTSNGFFYSVRGNFAFTRSLCIDRDEAVDKPEYQSYRGHSLGLSTALIALGLFEDQNDIDTSPVQDFGPVRPGDIKYRDVNGDGIINGEDEVLLGYPKVPEIAYGFGFTMAYKGFDLSLYFTGAAHTSYYYFGPTVYPFMWGNDANVQREFYENRWRPGVDNSDAKYPAVSPRANSNNNRISTMYMRDGSYLRLKNAEIGYTLPRAWMEKVRITNCRLFVNGIDLLLFDKLKIADPESDNGNIGNYPKQRTINGGIEITF